MVYVKLGRLVLTHVASRDHAADHVASRDKIVWLVQITFKSILPLYLLKYRYVCLESHI